MGRPGMPFAARVGAIGLIVCGCLPPGTNRADVLLQETDLEGRSCDQGPPYSFVEAGSSATSVNPGMNTSRVKRHTAAHIDVVNAWHKRCGPDLLGFTQASVLVERIKGHRGTQVVVISSDAPVDVIGADPASPGAP